MPEREAWGGDFDREAQQVGDNRWHPREQLGDRCSVPFKWCRGKGPPLLIQNTESLLSMNNIEIYLTTA